jgi:hypothetical protein
MEEKNILSEAGEMELVSGEAREIIGRIPPWMVRWGITVICLILVGFVLFAAWFRYPDEQIATAVVRLEAVPGVSASTGAEVSGSLVVTRDSVARLQYWVQADLSPSVAVQVQPGQKVLVRLDAYPAEAFGVLEGRLDSVSYVPVPLEPQMAYPARVSLERGLVTSFGIALPSDIELHGKAHILGTERSLLERFLKSAYGKR